MASRIKSGIVQKMLRIAVFGSKTQVLIETSAIKICAKICACGSLNVYDVVFLPTFQIIGRAILHLTSNSVTKTQSFLSQALGP